MNRKISLQPAVKAFASVMLLLSVALNYFVHPGLVRLAALVGANRFQQTSTGFCGAAIIVCKLSGLRPAPGPGR